MKMLETKLDTMLLMMAAHPTATARELSKLTGIPHETCKSYIKYRYLVPKNDDDPYSEPYLRAMIRHFRDVGFPNLSESEAIDKWWSMFKD